MRDSNHRKRIPAGERQLPPHFGLRPQPVSSRGRDRCGIVTTGGERQERSRDASGWRYGVRRARIADDDDSVSTEHEGVATSQPKLFLAVGLPATGKTTASRRLEAKHHALRLTKDEWMKALYGEANPPSASDVIEGRLIEIGLRALELGSNVVIDFGLWSRDERSALRQAAADRGASVEMHYFEVSASEQRRRLDQRQADEPHTTWPISPEELAGWADVIEVPTPGEMDGSEPIGDPPAGFGSWDEWRSHRWPPTIA